MQSEMVGLPNPVIMIVVHYDWPANTDDPVSSLPRAEGARFNSSTRQDESGCLEQTRVDVLRDIDQWIMDDDKDAPWMFVLQGLAGTGKSTIAHTVCKKMTERGRLGASFFFSRNEASCSNPFLVFTTIAYQLAIQYPQFRNTLTKILKSDSDIVGLNLEMQLVKLMVEPIRAAADDIGSDPVVVVIDAVDECGNYRAQILSLLCALGPKLPVSLKLFVSLRPEHDLKTVFSSQDAHWGARSLILHDVDAFIVRDDIERFLRFRLSKVAATYPEIVNPCLWPSSEAISSLAEKSANLFIFAATVVKFVEDTNDDPRSQLNVVLRPTVNNGPSPYRQLDRLYQQVLEHALPENADDVIFERFRTVMGAVTLLYDTLTIFALGRLLQMEAVKIRVVLLRLSSVIVVVDYGDEIRLIHPSFRDFMMQRCPAGSRYFINPANHHRQLVLMCFKLMHDYLRKDICGIRDMWKLNVEVEDLDHRIAISIPAHLQYACCHWATHLSEAISAVNSVDDGVCDALMLFSSLHFLHWLEVLSLTGRLAEALPALRHAQIWASKTPQVSNELCDLLYDSERFTLEFFSPISLGALHVYYSALPFTPQSQLLRQVYHYELGCVKVLSGLPQAWNPWLFSMHGHSHWVHSVAFSPDGSCIASGSADNTIRIWDAKTGVHLATLKGHSISVYSVAFSPDGSHIASGSGDRTVQIWDAKTGVHLTTLIGHSDWVRSVAFSPGGSYIASGSYDKTVRIWDARTSVHLATLEGHSGYVYSVTFSPDGSWIASGSDDKTVRIWDAKTSLHLTTLKGHSFLVTSVAFSPDGSHIASGSGDRTVRIWDAKTGVHLATLEGHSFLVTSIAFSPDGSHIASGSGDKGVQIWDAKTRVHLATLEGHSDWVKSVAFSPDGSHITSASHDQTVRIWDAKTGVHLTTLKGDSYGETSVAFSPDGSCIASSSGDRNVCIWDTKTGVHLTTLMGHSDQVTSVEFSPDGSHLALGSW
ncbi:hypothetical protein PILCRDRAFT_662423, partial [Piloderma croceum F 1598]